MSICAIALSCCRSCTGVTCQVPALLPIAFVLNPLLLQGYIDNYHRGFGYDLYDKLHWELPAVMTRYHIAFDARTYALQAEGFIHDGDLTAMKVCSLRKPGGLSVCVSMLHVKGAGICPWRHMRLHEMHGSTNIIAAIKAANAGSTYVMHAVGAARIRKDGELPDKEAAIWEVPDAGQSPCHVPHHDGARLCRSQ